MLKENAKKSHVYSLEDFNCVPKELKHFTRTVQVPEGLLSRSFASRKHIRSQQRKFDLGYWHLVENPSNWFEITHKLRLRQSHRLVNGGFFGARPIKIDLLLPRERRRRERRKFEGRRWLFYRFLPWNLAKLLKNWKEVPPPNDFTPPKPKFRPPAKFVSTPPKSELDPPQNILPPPLGGVLTALTVCLPHKKLRSISLLVSLYELLKNVPLISLFCCSKTTWRHDFAAHKNRSNSV